MTTDDHAARLQTVQGQIAQAQRARARLEVERSSAQSAAQSARERLAKEFGVETADQARAVLADLESKREAALAAVEEQLRRLSDAH